MDFQEPAFIRQSLQGLPGTPYHHPTDAECFRLQVIEQFQDMRPSTTRVEVGGIDADDERAGDMWVFFQRSGAK